MILRIILIIFLIGLLAVGFSAVRVIGLFREGLRQFRQQASGQPHSQQQQRQGRSTGQVVVDHRDADEANQKIFRKDEGEYVDFEEKPAEPQNRQ